MKICKIKGDLIEAFAAGEENVIAHGCNCFNTMKSGFAKYIVEAFPTVTEADSGTMKGSSFKMGKYTVAERKHKEYGVQRVYNLYTQFNYGVDRVQVEWDALEESLIEAFRDERRIAIPLIGCGLAGGQEEDLFATLDKVLDYYTRYDKVLAVYRLPNKPRRI